MNIGVTAAHDESAPLLPSASVVAASRSSKSPKPLPAFQITVLLIAHVGDSLGDYTIAPFVAQLVSELDGIPQSQVGYYVGLIESFYYATGAITILQWSRWSDHVGRKPIVMIGLASLVISMLSFGMARTIWGLVASRCIASLFNGKLGAVKSTIGELTDSTNVAHGFAMMRIARSVGDAVGPLIGGTLAKFPEQHPRLFPGAFWARHPYFLPCLVTATYCAVAFGLVVFCFEESMAKPLPLLSRRKAETNLPRNANDGEASALTTVPITSPEERPIPPRELLHVRRVQIALANYVSIAFLSSAFGALRPLFYASPVTVHGSEGGSGGGLGLAPSAIGLCLGAAGLTNGLVLALGFARLVRRIGPRHVFMLGVLALLPVFALFPLMHSLARAGMPAWLVWVFVGVQLVAVVVVEMANSCIYIFVTCAAPNKRSLGATNGLALTLAMIARAIGPATSTSLFAYSTAHGVLGGAAVYVVLALLTCASFVLAIMLPEDPWK